MDNKKLQEVYQNCEELRDEWASIASWCESVGLIKEASIMRQCIGDLWKKVQEPIKTTIKEEFYKR